MQEIIVVKDCKVNGVYEEPMYDHAPWITSTRDVVHNLHVGDTCYVNDENMIFHESNEYGESMYPGTLWLCPSQDEKESIFGQLTESVTKSWLQLMEEKSEIEESLKYLRDDLYNLEMIFDYHLDAENKDASLDSGWLALTYQMILQHKFSCLEFHYSGICMSIRLLAKALQRYHFN